MKRLVVALALAALPALALHALALAAVPMKDGHPNLSGYWDLDMKVPKDAALMKKIGPNTAVLEDTGPVEFPRNEYGGLKLDQAKRLKELERENARLRKAVSQHGLWAPNLGRY